MTTSSSIDFSSSTKEIITEALELLGVLGEGESYNTDQYTSAKRTLNSMSKTWQADGLNLFAVKKYYLFLKKAQPYYDLINVTQDDWTDNFGQRFVETAALTGATTITLDDATDASVGMFIGISVGGADIFWTTITLIVGNVVTLSDALEDDVDADAVVYYYLTRANRPMRVLEAYIHRKDGSEIPVYNIARVDYMELARKDTSGMVTQIYFDPQVNTPRVYVWPVSNSAQDYLVLACQRTLEDFDNNTDEPDYPQEWYMPLAYNLATFLAPKFGIPTPDYQRIQQQAKYLYDMARGFDAEQETSLFFKPDRHGSNAGVRS